ncbi:NAD-P-binding protein [Mycena vulgaris]|nr:NAD-P-binding protein [Mycena vulgaris]
MPSIAAVRAANATYAPSYLPVAIFVGGTSGIGRATAEALARYTSGNAHIILVGRNTTAANTILASFPKPAASSSQWKHEFVECDASLLSNVHAAVAALLARLPRVHFLVLSAGYFSLAGRDDTAEGLDRKLVLNYYARWAFATGMLPALQRAAGEPASVLSVLGAGHGPAVDLQDLGLVKGYSGKAARDANVTYMDLMVEELTARNPEIAFTHTYPGFVNTPLFNFEHWAARLMSPLIKLAVYFVAKGGCGGVSPLWPVIRDGGGASPGRVRRRDCCGADIWTRSDASRLVWAHTEEVVSAHA